MVLLLSRVLSSYSAHFNGTHVLTFGDIIGTYNKVSAKTRFAMLNLDKAHCE